MEFCGSANATAETVDKISRNIT